MVFNLRRRLGYHLFHTYIPSGLIVVMSWISFWIKPEAIPARVTLGVTSLLTLGILIFLVQYFVWGFYNYAFYLILLHISTATQSTQSQRSLPPVSYVKAIDVWMSSCTLFVFMSLMQFAVIFLLNMHLKKIQFHPIFWKWMNKWYRYAITLWEQGLPQNQKCYLTKNFILLDLIR